MVRGEPMLDRAYGSVSVGRASGIRNPSDAGTIVTGAGRARFTRMVRGREGLRHPDAAHGVSMMTAAEFNAAHPVGTRVGYQSPEREGESVTASPAVQLLPSMAVVLLEDRKAGAVALSGITVLDDGTADSADEEFAGSLTEAMLDRSLGRGPLIITVMVLAAALYFGSAVGEALTGLLFAPAAIAGLDMLIVRNAVEGLLKLAGAVGAVVLAWRYVIDDGHWFTVRSPGRG
jgi:hypothetical protein